MTIKAASSQDMLELALQELIASARSYTYAREACPIGDWRGRIEDAGYKLAQAVRAYDKHPEGKSETSEIEAEKHPAASVARIEMTHRF